MIDLRKSIGNAVRSVRLAEGAHRVLERLPNAQKSARKRVMRASCTSMLQIKCIDVVGRCC